MKILCFIFIVLSVLTTSCTHIRHYSTFDEINSKTKDKKAKIILKDEQELMGKDVYITPDSTFWIDPDKGNKQSVITFDISSIVISYRLRGTLKGLGIGLSCGAIIGMLAGLNVPFGFMIPLVTAPIGAIFGTVIGLGVGDNDKYIIDYKEEIIKEMEKDMEIEKIKTNYFKYFPKVKKEEFLFNVDLSAPLIPNSTIKLKVPPHAIQNILEHELSSKGFVVVSEGDADYKLCFLYSEDENKRAIGFTSYVINLSTDKIVGVANFQNDPYKEISITEIIKEFVNQLCQNIK